MGELRMWESLPPDWQVVGIGDFNGDGYDLLLRNDDGTVTNWLGGNGGDFDDNSTNFDIHATADWQIIGTGRFDSDGRADIMWRSSDGTLTNWVGLSNGSFTDNWNNFNTHADASWQIGTEIKRTRIWIRLMTHLMASLAVWSLIGTATPANAACPIANSSFAGPRDALATFRYIGRRSGWVSDLALGVRAAKGHATHWFLFDRGAARYVNLISTTDVTRKDWKPPSPDGGSRPLGEMHFLAATRDLHLLGDVPSSRDAAPSYLLLPDLPEVLAHRGQPPENIELFFFKLAHCGK
jgi:hypothetical protein